MVNYSLKVEILKRFSRQVDFCREAGIREDRLSRIVCGRSIPTEDERRLIAGKLGVSEDKLFGAGGQDG